MMEEFDLYSWLLNREVNLKDDLERDQRDPDENEELGGKSQRGVSIFSREGEGGRKRKRKGRNESERNVDLTHLNSLPSPFQNLNSQKRQIAQFYLFELSYSD